MSFDFAGLYQRHAPAVYRYALFLSGERATAEDLVAETFVKVWGARERVELSTVQAYLLAIARNLFLKGLRRTRPEAGPDAAGVGQSLDAAYATSEELRRVLSHLRTLPEIDRAALLLRADEGLPYEEIARILNITPVAARVKVHRARARLAALREEP